MKFLILFVAFAQAQMGGFGNNPPSIGMGMDMGSTGVMSSGGMFVESLGTCINNSYAFHPKYGFGYFVKKSPLVHDTKKRDECVFFSIKDHGYPVINRYSTTSVQECISGARCEKVSNNEGKRVVSIACPPFQMNGQEVVAVRDLEQPYSVEILIRSDTPAAIEGQNKKDRREQIVRKSAYVVQTIDKNYLLDSVLSGSKYPVRDLSDNPSRIFSIIDDEKPGIYITSKCNPNDPGPVPVFGPEESGPWGTGSMGLPGGGMMPPSTSPAAGAR